MQVVVAKKWTINRALGCRANCETKKVLIMKKIEVFHFSL